MAEKFKVTDPRGREITCSDECWDGHVVKAKPRMAHQEGTVKGALEEPDGIAQDVDFRDRQCYYKLLPHKKCYMKVVVELENDHGKVITAFLADSPKRGEKFIWMP